MHRLLPALVVNVRREKTYRFMRRGTATPAIADEPQRG